MTRKRRNVITKANVTTLIAWMVQNKAVFIDKKKKIDWIAKQATDTLGFQVTTNNVRHAIYRHPELSAYAGRLGERKRRLEEDRTPLFNESKVATEAAADPSGRMQLMLPPPLLAEASFEQKRAHVETLWALVRQADAFRQRVLTTIHATIDMA